MNKLTCLELKMLQYLLQKGYKYIARDRNNKLWVYMHEPCKGSVYWGGYGFAELEPFSSLFQMVRWCDSKPCSIVELLGE